MKYKDSQPLMEWAEKHIKTEMKWRKAFAKRWYSYTLTRRKDRMAWERFKHQMSEYANLEFMLMKAKGEV